MVGAMPLVPQMADALRPVPVAAAGGIADGRGVIAALALGAAGVQMGTAFLGCPQANIHPAYRRALLGGGGAGRGGTVVTAAFTGRPARVIRNRFVTEMGRHADATPSLPVQGSLTAAIRRKAAERDLTDYLAMWAGQAAPLTRERPAGELVAALVEEAGRVIGTLRG